MGSCQLSPRARSRCRVFCISISIRSCVKKFCLAKMRRTKASESFATAFSGIRAREWALKSGWIRLSVWRFSELLVAFCFCWLGTGNWELGADDTPCYMILAYVCNERNVFFFFLFFSVVAFLLALISPIIHGVRLYPRWANVQSRSEQPFIARSAHDACITSKANPLSGVYFLKYNIYGFLLVLTQWSCL